MIAYHLILQLEYGLNNFFSCLCTMWNNLLIKNELQNSVEILKTKPNGLRKSIIFNTWSELHWYFIKFSLIVARQLWQEVWNAEIQCIKKIEKIYKILLTLFKLI